MLSAIGDVFRALFWIILLVVLVLLIGPFLEIAMIDQHNPLDISGAVLAQPTIIVQTIEIHRYGKDCAGYDVHLASGPAYCFPPDYNSWSLEKQNQWIMDQR